MDDELQELRRQIEELTELYLLQSQRAMDYAAAFMRSKREWQGLTDEEAFDAFGFNLWPKSFLAKATQEMRDTHEEAKNEVLIKIRAIEAKLKEKNGL